MTTEERFWAKVTKTETCWLWTGSTQHGYGQFSLSGATGRKPIRAHRYAYELLTGPIPANLQLDHLCRVRNCVNPAHLEPVTQRENLRRGNGWPGIQARKTHCAKGHPFDEANTRVDKNGGRSCRVCDRETKRHLRAAQKALAS